MQINIRQAMKYFYKSPSLENVFTEAIHNSIDANASKIDIEISIKALDKVKTLTVKITDNGIGFTDERYEKFCRLMSIEEETHRGVGRLVYLVYFDKISISSKYAKKQRTFTYDINFDEHQSDMRKIDIDEDIQETSILFENCSLEKLSSYYIISPEHLRNLIINKFYPILYILKQAEKELIINITLDVNIVKKRQIIGKRNTQISLADIPILNIESIELDMFKMFATSEIHYSIKKQDTLTDPLLITALCIDNRTYDLSDVISVENLQGYDSVFLLNSTAFKGQTDPSREMLTLNETQKRTVIKLFRDKISEIIQREIPVIKEKKEKSKESLNKTYPHLIGYFDDGEIGVVARSKSIEAAQEKFLRDQKEILEAHSLDDKQYDKALELSSRSLSEYVLYREKIIGKVENITKKNHEEDLHNIILPKGAVLRDNTDLSNIYSNNLWLLDEKYMTYNTAMSNKSMKEIIEEISQENLTAKDTTAPDIVITFSDNPKDDNNKDKKIDVVIVELKRKGIPLAKTEEVISQLRQRARKLMKFYPDKIQRIWFYGIVEFNDEFKMSLMEEKYTSLYSKDILYYKENEVLLNINDTKSHLIGTYILSIDAFIEDAKARNAAFLQILKDGFQKIKNEDTEIISTSQISQTK
jgi:anti-sigma regulatory factor (Ser/Thr protein kinase)